MRKTTALSLMTVAILVLITALSYEKKYPAYSGIGIVLFMGLGLTGLKKFNADDAPASVKVPAGAPAE